MPIIRDGGNTSRRPRRSAATPHPARRSWFELVLFFFAAAGMYLIAALFDSAWTGASGRQIGAYLRAAWGGALLVPLLFWLYLCFAWFIRLRIPRPLGQILGTFQLYLSIAFMLGLFRRVGWNSSWILAEPGRVGDGLAHFFVLNLGVLGTVLVSFASLFLSGLFFGSRFLSLLSLLPAAHPSNKEGLRHPSASEPEGEGRKEPWEPRSARRREEGRSARLVRNSSPGGVPFDPLRPVGTLIAFDRAEESETDEPLDRRDPEPGEEVEAPFPAEGVPVSSDVEERPESDAPRPEPSPEAPAGPELHRADGAGESDEGESDKKEADEAGEVGGGKEPLSAVGFDDAGAVVKVPMEALTEVPTEASTDVTQQTAVEILDQLLESLESGEFDVPLPPRREIRAEERPSIHRPPLEELMDLPIPLPSKSEEEEKREKMGKTAGEAAEPPQNKAVEEGQGIIEVTSTPKVGPEERTREIRERLDLPSGTPHADAEGTGDGRDTAVQELFPDVVLPEDEDGRRLRPGAFPPPLDLLGPPVQDRDQDDALELANKQAEVIVDTLQNFGVKATVAHIVVGPSVIQFQIELAPGIKVSKVAGLANDLTMALAVVSVRVEAPILGQHYVGIEIPNPRRKGIALRSVMESEDFQQGEFLLPLPMGMRVDSRYLVCGLEDMPHLLVAGTTGSGKSVFVNGCILGMCLRRPPEELRLILVDPKHVEFAIYEGLPHLLARPVSDPRKAIAALSWAVQEMERRTECFARARVRNLASYNDKVLPKDRFPNIVVVVDELADLMYTAGKEVEGLIARLAQKARAAGIHLILATQRPSVDVITGLIKANVPARVAFAVPSQTDSRTIIDAAGADKLLGKGDMLFFSTRYPRPLRLQAPFITEERTLDFVEYMKGAFGEPEYIEFEDPGNPTGESNGKNGASIIDDPKMEEAIRVVMDTGIASASGLQRYLNIGYPRAGRVITGLEQLGIVGPQSGNSSKPRDILMDEEGAFEALERARTGGLFDED